MASNIPSLLLAFILRMILIAYGCWHDTRFEVKFTDVDYEVFSGASRYLWQGYSPYNEPTYKYTPLLSIILLPNIFIHKLIGKVIFSVFDIINSVLITKLLLKLNVQPSTAQKTVNYLLLFNPLIAIISTRGNAESIQNFFVLSSLYCYYNERLSSAGLLLGLAVHFKLYPVIFIIPIMLSLKAKMNKNGPSFTYSYIVSLIFNSSIIRFISLVIGSFLFVGCAMYLWLGYEFLWSTYIFHFSRVDLQHNFSIYFYPLYLVSDHFVLTKLIGVCAFVPQALTVAYYGIRFYKHLPVAMFMQCFAFVSFNKVCTSQYFIWYIGLLPLVLPWLQISSKSALRLTTAWISAQALWLGFAFLLEFKHYNVMPFVWMASVIFLIVNIIILRTMEQSLCTASNAKLEKD